MSKKEFIQDLNKFLKLVDMLNFIKTDNSNIIYSFGGNRPSDVLSYKIRKQLYGLIESFKKPESHKVDYYLKNLKKLFNSSFILGEINKEQLDMILNQLDNLVEKYNGAVK